MKNKQKSQVNNYLINTSRGIVYNNEENNALKSSRCDVIHLLVSNHVNLFYKITISGHS